MLGWIVGNATWMMSEFLFEAMKEPSRHFYFWNKGPILHVSHEGYGNGLLATRVTLFTTLSFLLVYLIKWRIESSRASASERRCQGAGVEAGEPFADGNRRASRVQDLFHLLFVTIWIIKDICWTYESLAGALLAAIALIILSLKNICVKGLVDPGMQISELLWVQGNAVWAITEVWDSDRHAGPRLAACLLLLAGVLVASINVSFGHCVPSIRTRPVKSIDEVAPLLPGADAKRSTRKSMAS
jgi:hypothetical protein